MKKTYIFFIIVLISVLQTNSQDAMLNARYVPKATSNDNNLIDGIFSVSSTKKVKFTKGNLYWDGSEYHIESKQTDYSSSWDKNHSCLCFWISLADYLLDKDYYMPYSTQFGNTSRSISDKFFCSEENPLTVDGTSGLFALTQLEWDYLLNRRYNALNLVKCGVKVESKKNCMIIAPDNFRLSLKSSYSLDELKTLGLVCLPPSGQGGARSGRAVYLYTETHGYYWTSTPASDTEGCVISFNFEWLQTNRKYPRAFLNSVRLVQLVQ